MKAQKGYTLIEVMIVVALIGIVGTVAVNVVMSMLHLSCSTS